MKTKNSVMLALALCAIMVFSSTHVLANSGSEYVNTISTHYSPPPPPGWSNDDITKLLWSLTPEDVFCQGISAFGSVIVGVNSLGDQYWRNLHPTTWMWEAARTVTAAGEFFRTEFSINLSNRRQTYWTSPNTLNGTTLINHAWNTHGTGGHQMMVAFTGRQNVFWHDGDTREVGGLGFTDRAGSLVVNFWHEANIAITRHEIGHNYGLSDHRNADGSVNETIRCFMGNPFSWVDSMCTSCHRTVNNNRNRY